MSQIPEPQSPQDATERIEETRRIAAPPPQSPVPRRPAEGRPTGGRQSQGRRPAPHQAQRAAYPPPESAVPPQGYPPPASSARRRRAARTAPPSENGLYLPWWSLVLLVGSVGAAAFGLLLVFSILAEPQNPGDQPPRVQVVTSQPTLSQDFAAENAPAGQSQLWPTPIPQAQPSATVMLPTPRPSPSLPPGQFQIGAMVQVVGVETSGLNVRSTPGLAGDPLFLAAENELFAIVGGPQNANDLEWWKIADPDDPERTGWAARNFLMTTSP